MLVGAGVAAYRSRQADGDPDLVVDDATPVVLQRIRLVETL